jgi:hypothetical protein
MEFNLAHSIIGKLASRQIILCEGLVAIVHISLLEPFYPCGYVVDENI